MSDASDELGCEDDTEALVRASLAVLPREALWERATMEGLAVRAGASSDEIIDLITASMLQSADAAAARAPRAALPVQRPVTRAVSPAQPAAAAAPALPPQPQPAPYPAEGAPWEAPALPHAGTAQHALGGGGAGWQPVAPAPAPAAAAAAAQAGAGTGSTVSDASDELGCEDDTEALVRASLAVLPREALWERATMEGLAVRAGASSDEIIDLITASMLQSADAAAARAPRAALPVQRPVTRAVSPAMPLPRPTTPSRRPASPTESWSSDSPTPAPSHMAVFPVPDADSLGDGQYQLCFRLPDTSAVFLSLPGDLAVGTVMSMLWESGAGCLGNPTPAPEPPFRVVDLDGRAVLENFMLPLSECGLDVRGTFKVVLRE